MTLVIFQDMVRYMRQAWYNSVLYRFTLMGGAVPKHLTVMPTDPWSGDTQAGRLLLEGKITFGNHIIAMTDLWMPKDLDSEVLADLHKFTWLRDLRTVSDNSARRLARQLITNWIECNQDWRLFSWRVDITGHRVANWIALYDFFCSSADENFRSLFFQEIARQVRHLIYSWKDAPTPLERFFSLKGILYAAITFPEEHHHLKTLLPQLEKEVRAQLWSDGSHKSRCPHTHLIVLRDLIDIRSMLRLIHYEIPTFLQTTISQMAPIVRLFRHGDGGLATFGSFAAIPPPVIDMVLSLADVRGRPPERALVLGFERCVNKSSLLLLNVGGKVDGVYPTLSERGTGSLNFEWSIGRDRLVIQGDLLLQTPGGKHFQISDSITPQSIQLRRTSQKGLTLLDVTYTHPETLSFLHRRQLCLGGKQSHLRGEDTIQVSCEAAYGIRFVLDQALEASVISGKRGVLIRRSLLRENAPTNYSHEKSQWRLLASGAEEIICESYEATQAILLLGRTQINQPISIQWAFCQD